VKNNSTHLAYLAGIFDGEGTLDVLATVRDYQNKQVLVGACCPITSERSVKYFSLSGETEINNG